MNDELKRSTRSKARSLANIVSIQQCHAIGENEKRRKSGSNEVQNMIINGPDDSISKISMQKKVVRETAVAIKLIYSIRYTITIYRYTIKQLNILIISKNHYIYF